jgi:hypothetical protein
MVVCARVRELKKCGVCRSIVADSNFGKVDDGARSSFPLKKSIMADYSAQLSVAGNVVVGI